jgi:putative addiction module component (TIGR02574 family)
MQATLPFELAQLPALERLQLAQELLESVASEHSGFALSSAHRHEAQERLGAYHRNPEAPSFTLAQIKASLGIA